MKKQTARTPRANKPRNAHSLRVTGDDLEARRERRLDTAAILKTGRTALQIVAIGAHAATHAETVIGAAAARQPPRPPLDCAPGCAWCCHQTVGVAAPEVVRIVDYLKEAMGPQEMSDLVERTHAARQKRAAGARNPAGVPCPLLVNNQCSVYPVRPLTCRGFNSSDSQACKAAVSDGARIDIPVYAPQLRLMSMVLDGMRAGLREAGLQGDLLELTGALQIALAEPTAVQDWLAGKPVFAAARMG